MTLPVSSYEELLETVRCLNQETRQLQRQLDTPLLAQHLPAVGLNGGMPSRDMSPKMTLSLENKTTSEQVDIFIIHLIVAHKSTYKFCVRMFNMVSSSCLQTSVK